MNLLPLSKSTYQDAKKCPRYAYNRKIKKIQPPVGEAALKGVQFHNIVSDILQGESETTAKQKATYPDVLDWLALMSVNRPLIQYKKKKADSEAKVFATRNLDLCLDGKGADLIGIFDLVWFDQDLKALYILDWKTGRYENDNMVERNMYAALGKALHPQARTIFFELYFVQSNRSLISTYSWSSNDRVMVIKPPHGELVMQRNTINPMVLWTNDVLDEVESMDGSPTPGAHCRNWYGSECFYLREHCPAYQDGRKIRNAKVTE